MESAAAAATNTSQDDRITRSLGLNWELTDTTTPHHTTHHYHLDDTDSHLSLPLLLFEKHSTTPLLDYFRSSDLLQIAWNLRDVLRSTFVKLWYVDPISWEIPNVILIFQPAFPSLWIPFLSVSKWLFNYPSKSLTLSTSQRSHLSEWIFSSSQSSHKSITRKKPHQNKPSPGKNTLQAAHLVCCQTVRSDKPGQWKYLPLVDWRTGEYKDCCDDTWIPEYLSISVTQPDCCLNIDQN